MLNRDVIKYIAMFTMLLNHIANVFLTPGTFLAELFLDIGYFTAPTMCYFLVEGYRYTRSKRKYGQRLLLFAVLSEAPFCLAFTHHGVIGYQGLNMMFTLFFSFLILVVKEKVSNRGLQFLAYAVLIFVTMFCDWPLMAATYTLMFAYSIESRQKLKFSFCLATMIFAVIMYMSNCVMYPETAVWRTACACLGVVVSGIVVLCFYNGERAKRGQNFSKWFFYLFYPVHLLILGLLRLYMG